MLNLSENPQGGISGRVGRKGPTFLGRSNSLAPGDELSLTIPLTRWFALTDPGSYHLRFRLQDASGVLQTETNEIGFSVTPCTDAATLAECRVFLSGQHEDLEAVAGFDSTAAFPCMQEALARNSTSSVGIIDGLARIQSPA